MYMYLLYRAKVNLNIVNIQKSSFKILAKSVI